MKKISDFLKNNSKLISENQTDVQLQISSLLNNSNLLKINEIDSLSKNISDLSNSKELINEIDKKITPPLPGESKEKFVKRGLEKIREILLEKFL